MPLKIVYHSANFMHSTVNVALSTQFERNVATQPPFLHPQSPPIQNVFFQKVTHTFFSIPFFSSLGTLFFCVCVLHKSFTFPRAKLRTTKVKNKKNDYVWFNFPEQHLSYKLRVSSVMWWLLKLSSEMCVSTWILNTVR